MCLGRFARKPKERAWVFAMNVEAMRFVFFFKTRLRTVNVTLYAKHDQAPKKVRAKDLAVFAAPPFVRGGSLLCLLCFALPSETGKTFPTKGHSSLRVVRSTPLRALRALRFALLPTLRSAALRREFFLSLRGAKQSQAQQSAPTHKLRLAKTARSLNPVPP